MYLTSHGISNAASNMPESNTKPSQDSENMPKIEVELKTEQIENNSSKVKIILSLGDFSNVKKEAIIGYETKLNYDKAIFEDLTQNDVKGLNGWTATYSSESQKIVGDPIQGAANTDITEITFTLKNGVEKNIQTVVSMDNFLMADDDENDYDGYTLEKTITVNNEEPKPSDSPKVSEFPTNNPSPSTESTKIPTKTSDPTVAQYNYLPKAGQVVINVVVILFIFALVTGLLSGKGYFKYLKDTHKQINKGGK